MHPDINDNHAMTGQCPGTVVMRWAAWPDWLRIALRLVIATGSGTADLEKNDQSNIFLIQASGRIHRSPRLMVWAVWLHGDLTSCDFISKKINRRSTGNGLMNFPCVLRIRSKRTSRRA